MPHTSKIKSGLVRIYKTLLGQKDFGADWYYMKSDSNAMLWQIKYYILSICDLVRIIII